MVHPYLIEPSFFTFLVSYIVVSPVFSSLTVSTMPTVRSILKQRSAISLRCSFLISLLRWDPVLPFWLHKFPYFKPLPPLVHSIQPSRVQGVVHLLSRIQLAPR